MTWRLSPDVRLGELRRQGCGHRVDGGESSLPAESIVDRVQKTTDMAMEIVGIEIGDRARRAGLDRSPGGREGREIVGPDSEIRCRLCHQHPRTARTRTRSDRIRQRRQHSCRAFQCCGVAAEKSISCIALPDGLGQQSIGSAQQNLSLTRHRRPHSGIECLRDRHTRTPPVRISGAHLARPEPWRSLTVELRRIRLDDPSRSHRRTRPRFVEHPFDTFNIAVFTDKLPKKG